MGRYLLATWALAEAASLTPLRCFLSQSRAGCSPCATHLHAKLTSTRFFPGVAISTYAKYCYHKLQKAALTGAKKVHVSPGTAGRLGWQSLGQPAHGGQDSHGVEGAGERPLGWAARESGWAET